jgi:predicted ATPase/DNA-binding CsgD family transcriptional regulator
MEAEAGLLTLTGAGGCGKTCLALNVARGVLDMYPDGVWLVELAPLSDPALVDNAVAAVLGVREGAGQSLRDGLLTFLRPRALLLVLDNCEHLVEACARLSDALLGACPELRILATSREPLRMQGEVAWRVPSLTGPDPQRLPPLNELAGFSAVRLFVERAQAVRPGFVLAPENADAVVRVCARLEGMPLALELAAARMRVLAVGQIASRLDESFGLLVGGSRTAPSRQQTLEATLDWSYDLLTETEQVLLCRLSVFAGGFDLDAAEAVCSGDSIAQPDVLEVLTRLVDKSLVIAQERAEEERYRMLEPIRQYTRERLAAHGEETAIRSRHAAHYRALAEGAEPELWGPQQAVWLQRLERDHANLRAALHWLHERAEDAEAERRFAVALSRFWHTRGDLSEGRAGLRRALEAPGAAATRGLATALTWEASLSHHQGDLDEAVALGERAVAASRVVGDPVILGMALVTFGDNLTRPGDLDRAITVLDEGVAILRAAGDGAAASLSIGLGILGTALRLQGDLDRAAAILEEGLALGRSVGNAWGVGIALQDLAQVERQRGRERRAAALFAECLAVAQEIADSRRVAECLEGFAELAFGAGRAERAARLFGAAQALRDANGSAIEPVDQPIHASSLAGARQALGEAAFTAAWQAGRALPVAQAIGESLAQGGTDGKAGEPPTRPTPGGLLTARELEVAELIARGSTNLQIAGQLVISPRTVDRHVSNILNKLGLATRGQVAAWTVERQMSAVRD